MEKKCTKCGEVKVLSEFHKCKRSKDGYKSACKQCRNAQSKQRRIDHPGEHALYRKQYNADH